MEATVLIDNSSDVVRARIQALWELTPQQAACVRLPNDRRVYSELAVEGFRLRAESVRWLTLE